MRYQLRRAAGRYWLLDMEQEGVPYRRPLCMNEMGAAVWELLVRGLDREGIVEELCREYQGAREEIASDVEQFLGQLERQGIEYSAGRGSGI